MNNQQNDKLDNWLQKNVSHSEDTTKKVESFHKQQQPFRKPFQKNEPQITPNLPPQNGKQKLRLIPIGGLNEVGQNMMVVEYGNDMIVIDMGFQFPEEDMLGVDYVLPDFTYVQKNKHKLRGVLITHGHLDHIGAIPYISPKLDNPNFYGTKLTMGLVTKRLEEFGLVGSSKLNTISPDDEIRLGCFKIRFFRVNHSIPDCVGIIIETPVGLVVHTGDFKFDFNPADGVLADFDKLARLGKQNVLALFSDSTNATKPGHTMSESVIGKTLDRIIAETPKRLVIASFSSLIGRMQQIFDSAVTHKRKVFISGRSMISNIAMAKDLGYLNYPKDLVMDLRGNKRLAQKDNALILTTGSQGESLAALTRIALDEHHDFKLLKSDTVVFSSSPIMGNERAIIAVSNKISRKGVNVINNKIMDVHTSGHGQQEDLKMMISLVKPRFFIPVHGEYYMRAAHVELAVEKGIDRKYTILVDNGDVIEADANSVYQSKEKVESNYILVDGKGFGDLGAKVLSDRQAMSQNGVLVVSILFDKNGTLKKDPEIISHGFIYMGEEKRIMQEMTKAAKIAVEKAVTQKTKKSEIEQYVKSHLDRVANDIIERRPLIVPVIHVV